MALAATAAALVACSSSSSNSPSGTSGSAVDSCNAVCQKQGDKMCPNPLMVTVDQCKQLCGAFVGSASAACQAEIKAQSDCQLMQQDICTSEQACKMNGDAGSACM
jgi:hypothetical protein